MKLSKRRPVLITALRVSHTIPCSCARGDVQKQGVLNVNNWDPYQRSNPNAWPANDLRAGQNWLRVQNSRIPERHEVLKFARTAQRSKLTAGSLWP
jgi:hypothetical protein